MSFLSRISLANKSLIALITIAILLLGGYLIPSLKEELFPSISFPTISVVSAYAGASPSNVEKDVTNPLEQTIEGINGIQKITSYSDEGVSIIEVSYNYGTDLTQASQQLTQQINKVQSTLPSNVTPQVQTFSISDLPVIQLAVSSDQNNTELATALKQQVVPSLEKIDGVANVTVTGAATQIVSITLDPNKLKQDGISVSQVEGALEANNISIPAGPVTANGQTVPIKVGNSFNSLADLKNLVVGVKSAATTGATGGTSTTGGAGATGGATGGAGGSTGFPGAGGAGASGGATGGTGFSGAGGAGATGGATGGTTGGAGAGTQVPTAAPTPVKLQDVATVKEDFSPTTSLTRTNGKPSLGVSIVKTDAGNTVAISNAVHNQLASLQNGLGHNASITVVSDQAPSITSSVNDLLREGITGAVFAIIVILLFLFSIRSTLVTAISIPLSIVIALIGLYLGNYTLNILTLGGLTIAVGRVVDDSIVVLENIYRHLQEGEEKSVAIPRAVREVAGAVTASTLTTVSVFLPIAFTGGLVGQLFSSFAVAVAIALLASLFVALTIIPVLASWFLKAPRAGQQVKERKPSWLERGYVAIISWVTYRWWQRTLVLVAAVLILIVSLGLVRGLQTNLFGSSGGNTYSVSLALPPATSLDKTNDAAKQVENAISGIPHIKTYQTTVGSGGMFSSLSGGSGTNSATFSISSDPNADQTQFLNTLRDRLNPLKSLGTLTVSASQGGPGNSNLEVDVQAADETTLQQASQQVLNVVSKTSGLTDVTSNLSSGTPQIEVNVDAQKALKYGMTAAQVAQNLRLVYSGSTVSTITLNGTQQNVEVFFGSQANTVDGIKNLTIPTTLGNAKVSDLATVQQVNGPTQITHIGGNRTASITGTITAPNVGAVSTNVQNQLKKLSLPSGASYSLGGVTSDQSSTFSNLGLAVLVAIILVYCIMVVTFRSLLQPLILLVSIPFAATGSLILLLLTNTPLGASALIGFLMLVGIVVTNAIVLLDLVRQYRDKGLSARDAVIEGGRHRLRPILMTAIATILALMPLVLGIGGSGSGGFLSQPLGIVVIGGLASSTVLTLILVPTLYVIVESVRGRSGAAPIAPPQVNVVDENTVATPALQ